MNVFASIGQRQKYLQMIERNAARKQHRSKYGDRINDSKIMSSNSKYGKQQHSSYPYMHAYVVHSIECFGIITINKIFKITFPFKRNRNRTETEQRGMFTKPDDLFSCGHATMK